MLMEKLSVSTYSERPSGMVERRLWNGFAKGSDDNVGARVKMELRRNELHVALQLRSVDLRVVRSILEQNLCSTSQQDENGDQPAHLAARHGLMDCMKLLIEYDAPMGRKNHANLTPLGEAQMNGHKDIVKLIKENYSTNASHEYIWDGEIDRETACWFDCYDEEEQRLKWVRLGADGKTEISDTPPPIDIQRLIAARESGIDRKVERRIHPKSLLSMRHVEFEKKKVRQEQLLANVLKDRAKHVEERCAVKLQSRYRIVQAKRRIERRFRETVASTRVQRRFRHWIRCRRTVSSIKIQSVVRMFMTKSHFDSFLRERLWWKRASRVLAVTTQRLWRGFLCRRRSRQLLLVKTLPDPLDMRNHDYWAAMQRNARPPRREIGIFAEYTVGGFPRNWQERSLKLEGGYFRDAVFYANTITKRATWTQPRGFQFRNHDEYYALRVQTFWRARVAKRKIRLFTKAKLLLERAHTSDLELTKPSITTLCNGTLHVHAVLHQYDRARDLYAKIMGYMNGRGVDNPFVLYSYAIFEAVTNEEDWQGAYTLSTRDVALWLSEEALCHIRDQALREAGQECREATAQASQYVRRQRTAREPIRDSHGRILPPGSD